MNHPSVPFNVLFDGCVGKVDNVTVLYGVIYRPPVGYQELDRWWPFSIWNHWSRRRWYWRGNTDFTSLNRNERRTRCVFWMILYRRSNPFSSGATYRFIILIERKHVGTIYDFICGIKRNRLILSTHFTYIWIETRYFTFYIYTASSFVNSFNKKQIHIFKYETRRSIDLFRV